MSFGIRPSYLSYLFLYQPTYLPKQLKYLSTSRPFFLDFTLGFYVFCNLSFIVILYLMTYKKTLSNHLRLAFKHRRVLRKNLVCWNLVPGFRYVPLWDYKKLEFWGWLGMLVNKFLHSRLNWNFCSLCLYYCTKLKRLCVSILSITALCQYALDTAWK